MQQHGGEYCERREYVNRTPNEYLTDYRIEQAMHMLSGTASTVAEVARACGFTSASYFIRVFRKRTGSTPQQWRRLRGGEENA
ncbi:helix-turn-helix transcriptional regulator [Bifidobacterium pongonis]|uniref:helix-turn-helix transcriptional regulator n=1 Tax=Bifidobacterium pongonis TaxID=2834432 RepID=UPI001F1BADCF|nr:helix-turn-helix transcriptional regulator [Bifidobacterium pongonis]